MYVFVTGSTGTIGSAVVAELLGNGHAVPALARSDGSERSLEEAGAEVLRGELADLDVLRDGAARSDGVISLGSDRPIVTVAGTPRVAPGRASTEEDPLPLEGPVAGRARSVNALLEMASRGVRATAVRMPRTVHNQGRGGFAGMLIDQAHRSGISGYPGDGTQRWPAVHALDAAVLFRLALESAPAGTSWHAVADEGDAVRDIAAVIGRRPDCRSRRCHRRPSSRSAPSSLPTSPHPVPALESKSAGNRRTQACWRTWRTSGPDWWNPNKVPRRWRYKYESSRDL